MSMFEKRVEAACEAYPRWITDDDGPEVPWSREPEQLKREYRHMMRAALRAADAVCCAHPKCPGGSLCCCQSDAVVTEEMIAETILKALVFTNENSKPWADGLARDIAALFRGGAKRVT